VGVEAQYLGSGVPQPKPDTVKLRDFPIFRHVHTGKEETPADMLGRWMDAKGYRSLSDIADAMADELRPHIKPDGGVANLMFALNLPDASHEFMTTEGPRPVSRVGLRWQITFTPPKH
jgi:hypothetical protein